MKCFCDSGLPRRALIDAAGIFCCYVCDKCEDEKRASYNPAIFDSPTYNGTEESLEAGEYDETF